VSLDIPDPDEYTEIIGTDYRWYRFLTTPSTSITYTCAMYENVFDDAIAYGAFILIFRDFTKEVGDIWHIRLDQAQRDYDNILKSIKFAYDENDTGAVDDGEEVKQVRSITFTR
jgi:hypothetical protein